MAKKYISDENDDEEIEVDLDDDDDDDDEVDLNDPEEIGAELLENIEKKDFYRCEQILRDRGGYLKRRDRKDWEIQLKLAREEGNNWRKRERDVLRDVRIDIFCLYFLAFLHIFLSLYFASVLFDKAILAAIIVQFILYAFYNKINEFSKRHYENKWGYSCFNINFSDGRYRLQNLSLIINIYIVILLIIFIFKNYNINELYRRTITNLQDLKDSIQWLLRTVIK